MGFLLLLMSDILHFPRPHPGPLHFWRNGEGDSIFIVLFAFLVPSPDWNQEKVANGRMR